jgi:hypothetical protein
MEKRKVNPNSIANLRPRKPGEAPVNPGRKPSLLKAFIKDNGTSAKDVQLIFKNIIFEKTEAELTTLMNDKEQPMLIRGMIKAFLTDYVHGRIDALNSVLDRVYGKALQEMHFVDETPDPTAGMTYAERKALALEWARRQTH